MTLRVRQTLDGRNTVTLYVDLRPFKTGADARVFGVESWGLWLTEQKRPPLVR